MPFDLNVPAVSLGEAAVASGGQALVVGVTGVNASDNPGPGLGVAKSLKRAAELDVKVVALAYDALEPGVFLDGWFEDAFLIPPLSAGPAALLERLTYIQRRVGLDVLIPNLDSEVPGCILIQDALARLGIRTFLPTRQQLELRDKRHLAELATRAGIAMPRQLLVSEVNELSTAVADLGLPLVLKGAWYGAEICHDLAQARAAWAQTVARWGHPVIAQALVRGEEMNLTGIGDGRGGAEGMVAVRKLSTTGLGKIWIGVTVDHGGLLAAARDLLRLSLWRGPFELECIVDGDQVQLIEINPRFPAWIYCATGVGSNLPAALVRRALGEAPAAPSLGSGVSPGRLYVRYTDERICDLATLARMVTRGESL